MELFREDGIALYIKERALRRIITSTKQTPRLEAGGVLLGKKAKDWEKYIITDVGIPSKYDKQSPLSFVRDKQHAQELTNNAWLESSGEVNHIGEWHSHIFPSPMPSWVDRCDMKRSYDDGEFVFDHFFTLIVSSDLRVYVGIVEKGDIVDFRVVRVDKECIDIVRPMQKNKGVIK